MGSRTPDVGPFFDEEAILHDVCMNFIVVDEGTDGNSENYNHNK